MTAKRSIYVSAYRWHDKTYGNTYWSARVYVDGEVIAYLPFQYGYDNQHIHTALDTLRLHNILPDGAKDLYTIRKSGIDFYSSIQDRKQREVKLWGGNNA